MTRTPATAGITAIGALTAAAALLTVLPRAQADELSDLRANQELLQRRIDQLAQASAAPLAPASLKGSFPRSILIPGTDTSLQISGYVDLQMAWILSGGGASGGTNGVPTNVFGSGSLLSRVPLARGGHTVPGFPTKGNIVPDDLQHSRGRSFALTPKQSRIWFATRTPTAWGEAQTMFQFDFLGDDVNRGLHTTDSLQPRLRLAYGTLGPLLAGQAYSLMDDLESGDNTIDFNFNAHAGPTRVPQLRWTQPLPWWPVQRTDFQVALEAPSTSLITPLGQFDRDSTDTPAEGTHNPAGGIINPAKSTAPDGVVNLVVHQPWGHVRWALAVSDQNFQDGRFISKEFLGLEGAFDGNVKPAWFGWTKDDIGWSFFAGDGGGRGSGTATIAALTTNYGAFPILTAADAAKVRIRTITNWGGHVSYTHWWRPDLESNADFNIVHADVRPDLLGPKEAIAANKEMVFTHLNLLWHPVPFVQTGFEYFWGHRVVAANLKGDLNVILGDFRVKF